jgi:hypothetical protein
MWWLVAVCYVYLDRERHSEDAKTAVRYVQAMDEAAAAEAVTEDLARLCPDGRHLQRRACVVVYSAQVIEGLRELVDGWPV